MSARFTRQCELESYTVLTSCLFQAEHIKEAISVACISVAQRVVER